ncbi:piggyBac transposable element-derived protein 3-like [Nilaparvata lugens]|uniref:piggyBac transposable element-derived protein 3-like n=1 Tax=Nilaparvata lugens TaxID=108931 RepID=UPI00193D0782|nr:piggyBac transposable element-derived protein 3-like [Nilaparvata lugens]
MLCWHYCRHPPFFSIIASVCDEYKHVEVHYFCRVMASNENLSLFEIEEILAQDDFLDAHITLIPPEDILSEGDSGEEDEVDIDRLSKKQLLSHAEASMRRVTEEGIRTEIISSEPQPALEDLISPKLQANLSQNLVAGPSRDSQARPSRNSQAEPSRNPQAGPSRNSQAGPSQNPQARPSRNPQAGPSTTSRDSSQSTGGTAGTSVKMKKTYHWVEKDIKAFQEKEYELPSWLQESDGEPVELFELFYDDEVVNHICDFTNLYALQNGEVNLNFGPEECRVFIAILLVSGYCQVSRRRMYWEQSPDAHNNAISEAMSRNRFSQIMRYLHVCDNNKLDKSDRFSKISPLWKMLNERWLQYFIGETNLSVDESMIPYFGRHGAKQHMHGKPIRFGYKCWSLCTRLGYLIQGNLYQGAKTGNTIPELGVGGSVVMDLIDKLPAKSYNLFFDNFFSSIKLVEALKNKGVKSTGTIRSNRVERAPIIDAKILRKKSRGSMHQLTDESSGITLVQYHDNNIVNFISSQAGIEPKGKVKRYSQALKKFIHIDQPACCDLYNTYMGGVDRLDENISKMRINIRSNKWYWQLFSFPLNASMNNAWQLHRWVRKNKPEQLDLLAFTRQICMSYLQKYSKRLALGRPSRIVQALGAVDKRVTDHVRYDGLNHHIVPNERQSRCAQCKKNARVKCNKCNVALHNHCSMIFHSK